jgi:hypothetical protein
MLVHAVVPHFTHGGWFVSTWQEDHPENLFDLFAAPSQRVGWKLVKRDWNCSGKLPF